MPDWYLDGKKYMKELMDEADIFKKKSDIEQLDLDSLVLVGKILPYFDYKNGEVTWDPTEKGGYVNLLNAKENFTNLFREVLKGNQNLNGEVNVVVKRIWEKYVTSLTGKAKQQLERALRAGGGKRKSKKRKYKKKRKSKRKSKKTKKRRR